MIKTRPKYINSFQEKVLIILYNGYSLNIHNIKLKLVEEDPNIRLPIRGVTYDYFSQLTKLKMVKHMGGFGMPYRTYKISNFGKRYIDDKKHTK